MKNKINKLYYVLSVVAAVVFVLGCVAVVVLAAISFTVTEAHLEAL